MREERATRRSDGYGRAKSTEQVDAESIARRAELGGWILGAAVVLMAAAPMAAEALL